MWRPPSWLAEEYIQSLCKLLHGTTQQTKLIRPQGKGQMERRHPRRLTGTTHHKQSRKRPATQIYNLDHVILIHTTTFLWVLMTHTTAGRWTPSTHSLMGVTLINVTKQLVATGWDGYWDLRARSYSLPSWGAILWWFAFNTSTFDSWPYVNYCFKVLLCKMIWYMIFI